MRSVQLLILALLATAANADTVFGITFRAIATVQFDGTPFPTIFFTGTIVTDGTCIICSISQEDPQHIDRDGINSISTNFVIGLGDPNASLNAGSITFNTATDTLAGEMDVFDNIMFLGPNECPPGACPTGPNQYNFIGGGAVSEWGTFTVSPEPSSWLLLATCAIPIVVWRLMRRGTSERTVYGVGGL
jgi:hypothetical protein